MATFPFDAHVNEQTVTYRDAKGHTAKTSFYVDWSAASGFADAATFAGALVTLIDALTNAAIQSAHGPFGTYGVLQYGAHPAEYQMVEQKAVMVFQDSAGSLHRYMIPAPIIAAFEADQQTINPAQTAVAAYIAKMTTIDVNGVFVATRDDLPLANFVGGYFAARKLQRRSNVTVLTPALTPSLPAE